MKVHYKRALVVSIGAVYRSVFKVDSCPAVVKSICTLQVCCPCHVLTGRARSSPTAVRVQGLPLHHVPSPLLSFPSPFPHIFLPLAPCLRLPRSYLWRRPNRWTAGQAAESRRLGTGAVTWGLGPGFYGELLMRLVQSETKYNAAMTRSVSRERGSVR